MQRPALAAAIMGAPRGLAVDGDDLRGRILGRGEPRLGLLKAGHPVAETLRKQVAIDRVDHVVQGVVARDAVRITDSGFSALEFLSALRRHGVTCVTRLRLDAVLCQPAPPRLPGTIGRPRTKGARLPTLAEVLADKTTRWQRITVPGWYGEGRIEPHLGGAVELMGGHIRGVVTQWQPAVRLTYTWNVFNPGEAVSQYPESYLTFTLAAAGDGTALTLEHLPVLEQFVKLNAMGWHTYLDMLVALVRGTALEARDTYMTANAKRYGVDLANPLG